MSVQTLTQLIFSFCAVYTGQDKVYCYEDLVNCAVGPAGQVQVEQVNKCKANYKGPTKPSETRSQ